MNSCIPRYYGSYNILNHNHIIYIYRFKTRKRKSHCTMWEEDRQCKKLPWNKKYGRDIKYTIIYIIIPRKPLQPGDYERCLEWLNERRRQWFEQERQSRDDPRSRSRVPFSLSSRECPATVVYHSLIRPLLIPSPTYFAVWVCICIISPEGISQRPSSSSASGDDSAGGSRSFRIAKAVVYNIL